MMAQNNKLHKHIAGIGSKIEDEKKNLRANIAQQLAQQFKANNINAEVNPKTGTVTLLMEQNLLFETNSANLSLHAKNQLAKIITLYAKVLFGRVTVKEKISSFNVEGHASPSYFTGFIDPFKGDAEPYDYNLNLSSRRASTIINFIFSNKMKFPEKYYMRKLTRSVGYGFIQPVKNDGRLPASMKVASDKNNCGPYSCSLSQRVELSFTLKDDPKALEKLIEFKEGGL